MAILSVYFSGPGGAMAPLVPLDPLVEKERVGPPLTGTKHNQREGNISQPPSQAG